MQRSVERARGAWTKAEPYVRKDGTATRSTTVYLPVELAEQLRAEAHRRDVSQSLIIEEALRSAFAPSCVDVVAYDREQELKAKVERLSALLQACAHAMTRDQMFTAMKFAEPELGGFLVQLEGA